jgi:hypothetical protein
MRGIFPGCCACATAPPATNVKARASTAIHFGLRGRFWIADFGLSDCNPINFVNHICVMNFSPNPKTKIENPKFFHLALLLTFHPLPNCQRGGMNRKL